MKSKAIVMIIGMLFCVGTTRAVSISVNNDGGWIELGEMSMSSYFDESWHWTTATVFKLSNAPSLAYRIRYEGKYYPVRAEMDVNQIKCSVWIPYDGQKRCFSFVLPTNL